MHLLLISATPLELAATREFIESEGSKLRCLDIDFLIGGVGVLSTAHTLTKKILERTPGLVVQAGIAGATSRDLIGKTFVILSDEMADMGVTENKKFKSVFDLDLANKEEFPFRDGLIKNPNAKWLSWTLLETCPGITVNEITTDPAKIADYKQKYGFAVESMEGAACHYVCLLEKIPFLQIRTVSNEMGERDKSKWQLKRSIEALNEHLIIMLKKLNEANETEFGV
ncbi:MAG: futalosine hydrolase [Chitinophagales bacterium]